MSLYEGRYGIEGLASSTWPTRGKNAVLVFGPTVSGNVAPTQNIGGLGTTLMADTSGLAIR
jgi:hypothetical protein